MLVDQKTQPRHQESPPRDGGPPIENMDDEAMQAWQSRFQASLKKSSVRGAAILILVALVPIYFLTVESARMPISLTYLFIALALLVVGFSRITSMYAQPALYFWLTQVDFLGHTFALRQFMAGPPDAENSMILGCFMFVQGILLIIINPFRPVFSVLLAIEHVCLSVYAIGSAHPLDRIVAWTLLVAGFDAFACIVHLMRHLRLRRHAAAEMHTQQLQVQNERLRVEAMQTQMQLAQEVQDSLSPAVELLNCRHASVHFYQKRFDIMGGDWMGARVLSNGDLVLAIADVSGKGLPAAMVAQAINTLWAQALKHASFDPRGWLQDVDQTLVCMGNSRPYTATIGVAVVNEHSITYYSCGHVPLFAVKKTAEKSTLTPIMATGNIVGCGGPLDLKPVTLDLEVAECDTILLGTDGIFDRGARTKSQKIIALLRQIEVEGSKALAEVPVADDKLLIMVKRVA